MNDNDNQIDVAVIGYARVLGGVVSFKDAGIANINDTYRGQIYTEDHGTEFAIIKDLHPRELANEVIAALLAKMLGLPVPRAYIALSPFSDLEIKCAPSTQHGHLLFASVDVGAPSVATIVKKDGFSGSSIRKIIDLLLKGDLCGVYEFDTWSANTDRHPGNLLISGAGTYWMIDHGFCFSGPSWTAADLDYSLTFKNRLKDWVTPFLTQDEINVLLAAVGKISDSARRVNIHEMGIKSHIPALIGDDDFEAMKKFLSDRIPDVPRLTADALGQLI